MFLTKFNIINKYMNECLFRHKHAYIIHLIYYRLMFMN